MDHLRGTWALLLATACGSSFTPGAVTTDAASEAPVEASADVETHGPVDSGADSSADVDQGSSDGGADARFDVGTVEDEEAGPCTPLSSSYAQAPCTADYGPPTTPLGTYYWLVQPEAMPPACWARALNAAGLVCAQCASTWTCACLVASFGDAGLATGVTCIEGAYGPVLSE